MPQDLYAAYNSLSATLKQEVYDYVMFLAAKDNQPLREKKIFEKKGFGCLRDEKFWMAPDFDEPIADFKDYM